MNQIIIDTANDVGIFYVLFALVLTVSNTVVRILFDSEIHSRTKSLVGFTTVVIFTGAWISGGEFRLLFLYTFFTFGFYDFVGRWFEKLILKIIGFFIKKISEIKGKIFGHPEM